MIGPPLLSREASARLTCEALDGGMYIVTARDMEDAEKRRRPPPNSLAAYGAVLPNEYSLADDYAYTSEGIPVHA